MTIFTKDSGLVFIFFSLNFYFKFQSDKRNQIRNELIMIPIPKPKFFERKIPDGCSKKDYLNEIAHRQTHSLRDAINRVSCISLLNMIR